MMNPAVAQSLGDCFSYIGGSMYETPQFQDLVFEEQRAKTLLAQMQVDQVAQQMRPSSRLPIAVFREGSRWVCMVMCHNDPMRCPIAYGDSPEQACVNFDHLWNSEGYIMDDIVEDTDVYEDDDEEIY